MTFRELIIRRRTRRSYTGAAIPEDQLRQIVEAGLLAPTGRNLHPNEIILVRDKATLERLSCAKTGGSALLRDADCALVVLGETARSDTWVEDGAIMMAYMQLQAEDLGIGSCWVQIRSRLSQTVRADGTNQPSPAYVREALGIPGTHDVLAILALGMSDEERPLHTERDIDWQKLHRERF